MSVGLKRGTVSLEPHSMVWEVEAKRMITKLRVLLQDDMIDAQHIGSTSIKGICAKPIIDIVVGVSDFEKMMAHNDDLLKNGIVYRGEDYPGQLLYVCGDLENEIHTHYIHVVIWQEKKWNHYVNMRDYLNSHEGQAKKYSELKQQLAEVYPQDRISYTNGKSALIEDILQSADEWRNTL